MSGTHAQTAEAQADLQRADAQGSKPSVPPGHVEDERAPTRRIGGGMGAIAGLVALLFLAAIAFLIF